MRTSNGKTNVNDYSKYVGDYRVDSELTIEQQAIENKIGRMLDSIIDPGNRWAYLDSRF